MTIVGARATHCHPDQVGETMFGFKVEGLAKLPEVGPCPIHVHKVDANSVWQVTGLSKSDLVLHDGHNLLKAGDIDTELRHTPGHTPGSQCFCVENSLFAEDTVFLQGCSRVDFPGGDADEGYDTLTPRLSALPDAMTLSTGHASGGENAPLGEVQKTDHQLQIKELKTCRRFF